MTYKAMGTNIMEYWSNLKLMLILNVNMFNQWRLVMIDSMSRWMKMINGIREVKNAVFTVVFVFVTSHSLMGCMGIIRGNVNMSNVRRRVEFIISEVITFTWSCTKG